MSDDTRGQGTAKSRYEKIIARTSEPRFSGLGQVETDEISYTVRWMWSRNKGFTLRSATVC